MGDENFKLATKVVVDRYGSVVQALDAVPADIGAAASLHTHGWSDRLVAVFDGGGSVITAAKKVFVFVPFSCCIESVTLLADQSGSIVVDVWEVPYTSFPPTDTNSITASAPPTISGAVKSQDATLTGWNRALNENDVLCFNVDSCTSIQWAAIILKIGRTED
jgi:hypothetical protein